MGKVMSEMYLDSQLEKDQSFESMLQADNSYAEWSDELEAEFQGVFIVGKNTLGDRNAER